MIKLGNLEYRGHYIQADYCENNDSPDEWGDDERFIVYDHRNFTIKRKGFNCHDIFEAFVNKKKLYDGYFIFPLYVYIHSGVALSLADNTYPFNDRWDVSFKGFCLIKRIKGTYSHDKAFECADWLVKKWNQYLSGDVYRFSTEFDSCSGYYGQEGYDDMIIEAKYGIDNHIKDEITKHLDKLKKQIRNRVPLYYRKQIKIY